ncbi:MAG: prepilin peptidase [Bdellovibrionales bacterium]
MNDPLLNEPFVRLFVGTLVGLVLGSFTTMLSYRLPRGLSIVSPPSTCPSCGSHLTPRDLIPVVSWLIGRGRCRHCAAPIGTRYVVIELITTASIAAAFVVFGFTWALIVALIVIIALITTTTIYCERR